MDASLLLQSGNEVPNENEEFKSELGEVNEKVPAEENSANSDHCRGGEHCPKSHE